MGRWREAGNVTPKEVPLHGNRQGEGSFPQNIFFYYMCPIIYISILLLIDSFVIITDVLQCLLVHMWELSCRAHIHRSGMAGSEPC